MAISAPSKNSGDPGTGAGVGADVIAGDAGGAAATGGVRAGAGVRTLFGDDTDADAGVGTGTGDEGCVSFSSIRAVLTGGAAPSESSSPTLDSSPSPPYDRRIRDLLVGDEAASDLLVGDEAASDRRVGDETASDELDDTFAAWFRSFDAEPFDVAAVAAARAGD
jgi:hypothetical protein